MQERFIHDLRHQVGQLPGVKRVEFFGSVVTPGFRPGKSDLDMVVEGAISPQTKRRVVALIQDANQRHGLRLEESPYLHPVPFFVTNPVAKALLLGMAKCFSWGLGSRWTSRWKARQKQHPTTLQEFWGGWRPGPGDLRYYVAKLWG